MLDPQSARSIALVDLDLPPKKRAPSKSSATPCQASYVKLSDEIGGNRIHLAKPIMYRTVPYRTVCYYLPGNLVSTDSSSLYAEIILRASEKEKEESA